LDHDQIFLRLRQSFNIFRRSSPANNELFAHVASANLRTSHTRGAGVESKRNNQGKKSRSLLNNEERALSTKK
jgi:hypothetical protein